MHFIHIIIKSVSNLCKCSLGDPLLSLCFIRVMLWLVVHYFQKRKPSKDIDESTEWILMEIIQKCSLIDHPSVLKILLFEVFFVVFFFCFFFFFVFFLTHLSQRLRMSYCDHSLSVICPSVRPSVHTCEWLLLWNPGPNFFKLHVESWVKGWLKICTNGHDLLIKMTAMPIYSSHRLIMGKT